MSRSDRQRLAELRGRVAALYETNRRRGHAGWCGLDYDYVCPSSETYPFQWFWDSCLHAIVLSHLDTARAESELTTLLANQWPDGFISHVTYWGREGEPDAPGAYQVRGRSPWLSGSMQPPILAEAVAAVAARGRGAMFLREVLPAVRRYYDWCDRSRDPDRDGLIAILEPHESGMDQTPAYDAYLGITNDDPATFETAWRVVAEAGPVVGDRLDPRFAEDRFVVEDLAVNALYAENERVLAGLLAEVGDSAGSAELAERARRTTTALLECCWSPRDEDFHGLAGRDEAQLPGGTLAGLLPILLEDLPAAMVERIVGRLANPAEYGTRYPVPSVSRGSPAYRSAPAGGTVLWRGPSWINANWYLARGLRRHGHEELATRIEEASLELVERSGFREHYDAESGDGYGARSFAWSALVLDMLAARIEGDPAAG